MAASSTPPRAAHGGRLAPRLEPDSHEEDTGLEALTGSVVDRVVAAATHLFAAQGYERTTVQQIVDAAGVAKGAMYHHFTGKDDLLYEIYHRILTVQVQRLRDIVEAHGPIATRLHAAAVDVIATTVDNFDDLTVVARCMHLLGPLQHEAIRAERRRYHEAFRDMVIEGQRAGEFAADVDADLVANFFFGALHHLPAWFDLAGRLSGHELGHTYADLLLKTLATTER